MSGELAEEELALPHTTAKFDLTLFTYTVAERTRGTLEYSTDLFDRSTIERLAKHFVELLDAVASAPHRPLSELSGLSTAERDRVLVEWNDTAVPLPVAGGVHELITARAAAIPDAVAVVCAGELLSYAELNARANRLAYLLRAMGVRAETVVGVCLERGLDLVVALLAIWKGRQRVPAAGSWPPG